MNVFTMGWRNVWRNKRRSWVAIAAMTLALWVLLLYSCIIPGYFKSMEISVTQLEVGDVQIHAPGYLNKPSMYTAIDDSVAVLTALDQAGIAASPQLLGGGLAASGEFSAGVSLRGLDVERDYKVSRLNETVGSGEWLDPADLKGVVIGKRLAKNLSAKPGSELIVVSQGIDGSMANELYTVRGVLKAVGENTDRAAVFMNAAAFRELMVIPTGAHRIVLRRGDRELNELLTEVRGLAPELDAQTWKELMPMIAQMVEMGSVAAYIVSFIIYLAVGILILNAMLTAVFERIREFGVLKAIGAGPLKILSLILVEGAVQAGAASVLGMVLALPGMWYLTVNGLNMGALGGMDAAGVAMADIWYGEVTPQVFAGPLIVLWVMTMGAVVYPALKAALINPVSAMRHH